ncbi:hypothetical protein Tco_0393072 [Tanacetum coccineum]
MCRLMEFRFASECHLHIGKKHHFSSGFGTCSNGIISFELGFAGETSDSLHVNGNVLQFSFIKSLHPCTLANQLAQLEVDTFLKKSRRMLLVETDSRLREFNWCGVRFALCSGRNAFGRVGRRFAWYDGVSIFEVFGHYAQIVVI